MFENRRPRMLQETSEEGIASDILRVKRRETRCCD